MSKLIWNGDKVKQKAAEAARVAIDRTMSEAVIQAKNSHPGWKNITGTAEASVRIVTFAERVGSVVRGLWGSSSVHYVKWLELKHGSFLRSSADSIYPRLKKYLREEYNR